MGNAQATTTDGVPVQSTTVTSTSDVAQSGVRITGSAVQSLEDRVQQAFEQGRQEGVQSFQSTLEVVAGQVYENMHAQLLHIQQESLSKSEVLSKQLSEKLSAAPLQTESPCTIQKSALAACLKQNKGDPLVCGDLVNSFSKCATALI